jgi:hypothetical protein
MEDKYREEEYRMRVELPSDHPDDIRAMLNLPDQPNIKRIQTVLTTAEILMAKDVEPCVKPFRTITYFKILDGNGEVVTTFDPPLRIRITYSYKAWHEFDQCAAWQEKGRPRICYLEKGDRGWVNNWVEFLDSAIDFVAEPKAGGEGYIRITVSELPDPRIGGC